MDIQASKLRRGIYLRRSLSSAGTKGKGPEDGATGVQESSIEGGGEDWRVVFWTG